MILTMTDQTKIKERLEWLASLEQLQNEFKNSPYYKEKEKRRKRMKKFKKKHPLSSLFRVDPCTDCVVLAKCKKSYRDGSICQRYIKAIQKLIKGEARDARKRRRERRTTTTKTT